MRQDTIEIDGGDKYKGLWGAQAQLRALDLSDLSQPLDEVRSFLLARYGQRKSLHPRLMEMTVASVFRDMGYQSVVTGYQGDGGIDVILEDGSGSRVGVQVKRYRKSIEVEQIRALTGALFLGGFTRGVFVTTSRFQSGAATTARASAARGIPIELIDAERFYDALSISARSPYRDYQEWSATVGTVITKQVMERLVPTTGGEAPSPSMYEPRYFKR